LYPGNVGHFINALPEPMFVLSVEGQVLVVNSGACQALAVKASDILGKQLHALCADPSDKIDSYLRIWSRSGTFLPSLLNVNMAGGGTEQYRCEGAFVRPENNLQPTCILLRLQHKKASVAGFVALNDKIEQLTKEIIERKRVEQGLRDSEARVRLLLDSTAEAIFGVDYEGSCTFANLACVRLLGYQSQSDLLGRNMHQLIHHTHMDGQPYPIEECPSYLSFCQGREAHHEHEILWRGDGSSFPVELWSHPIQQDGKLVGAVVTFVDVSERHQVNNALQTLAKSTISLEDDHFFQDCALSMAQLFDTRYAAIALITDFEKRDVVTIAVCADGKLMDNLTCSLYGSPCEGIFTAGKGFIMRDASVLYPDHELVAKLAIDSCLSASLISSSKTMLGVIAVMDTKPMYISSWAETILNVFATRIALELEKREANKELHAYRDHLEELVIERTAALELANRELESYSYSIAHDLRSPLRSVTSYSQILIEETAEKLTVEEQDYTQRIIKSAKYMAQMIDDILNLSKITRGDCKKQQVDLSGLVNQVKSELLRHGASRDVKFIIQPHLSVEGDPNLLRLMIENLLENAWKFTGKKACAIIEFGLMEQVGEMTYFIRDNGAGFEAQYANKLFMPFQRLHTVNEFEGTGVGLASVARIVHRHGGKIWAKAEPEQGATFYFTFNPAFRIGACENHKNN